jgi:hypothetical protein
MVKREEFDVEIKHICKALTGGKVVRNEAGAWTLIIELDGEIEIDAARSLRVEGEIRIRGRQKGRKSNKQS